MSGPPQRLWGLVGARRRGGTSRRHPRQALPLLPPKTHTQGWEYRLEASFVEVYNETLRDLLAGGQGGGWQRKG